MKKIDWDLRPNFIATGSPQSRSVVELKEFLDEEDAWDSHIFVATSGSTFVNQTKWVVHSYNGVLASANAVNIHLQAASTDIWFQALPPHHVGGFSIEARAFLSGSLIYNWYGLLSRDEPFRWDVTDFYEALQTSKSTLLALVPTQVYDLVKKEMTAPENLRAVVVGGGALSEGLYSKARELGWPLLPSYGMTETCSQIATASLDSLNRITYPELEVLSHAKVRTDFESRLLVQAESLFEGYLYQNLENLEKIRWQPVPLFEVQKELWFPSEDRAQVENSTVRPLGRFDEVYKVAGELVSYYELSNHLQNVLDDWRLVKKIDLPEMALVLKPDERLGRSPELFVESIDVPSKFPIAEVVADYNSRVRPFEKIRQTHHVSHIPRSDLGKVLKNKL